MFGGIDKSLEQRLSSLEQHLQHENPVLVESVNLYRRLDEVAYRTGLLPRDESFALLIAWWPLIAVLGTFSAGKSSFINDYMGRRLQLTGNQAVDDRFSVVCYGREPEPRVLPGMALDADPRFPFYQISREIEKVAAGEGRRIDSYLQLKTCPCENARGKIVIDSPGFDADSYRSSTLRITDHIIDLSDLVLVFFDARHPEPGAMQDTLNRLVGATISRPDASKFLYILNQLDTAAREDNPEEVVSAWQRALAQQGLTSGRFYTIFSRSAGVPIENEVVRARFEARRDADMEEIHGRMRAVEVERAYRIVGSVESTAKHIAENLIPTLTDALQRWRKGVLWLDAGVLVVLAAVLGALVGGTDLGLGQLLSWSVENPTLGIAAGVVALGLLGSLHFWFRSKVAGRIAAHLKARSGPGDPDLQRAMRRSTRFPRSIFQTQPAGWNSRTRARLHEIGHEVTMHIQRLNDRYTDPTGGAALRAVEGGPAQAATSAEAPEDVAPRAQAN
jgi:hypothetical protein